MKREDLKRDKTFKKKYKIYFLLAFLMVGATIGLALMYNLEKKEMKKEAISDELVEEDQVKTGEGETIETSLSTEEKIDLKDELNQLREVVDPMLSDISEGITNVIEYASIAQQDVEEMKKEEWQLGMFASLMMLTESSEELIDLDTDSQFSEIQEVVQEFNQIGQTLIKTEEHMTKGIQNSDAVEINEAFEIIDASSQKMIDVREMFSFIEEKIEK